MTEQQPLMKVITHLFIAYHLTCTIKTFHFTVLFPAFYKKEWKKSKEKWYLNCLQRCITVKVCVKAYDQPSVGWSLR